VEALPNRHRQPFPAEINAGDLRPRTVFELGPRKKRSASGRGYYRHQFEIWWTRYVEDVDADEGVDNVRQLRAKAR